MSTRSTWRTLVALTFAGTALLASCGGDDSDVAEGPQMDNSEEALVAYQKEYLESSLQGAGDDTYPALSGACQAAWSQSDWSANEAGWKVLVERVTDLPAADLEVANIQVVEIDDSSARLTYQLANSAGETILDDQGAPLGEQERTWVYENGGWRTDDCPSLAEALAGD